MMRNPARPWGRSAPGSPPAVSLRRRVSGGLAFMIVQASAHGGAPPGTLPAPLRMEVTQADFRLEFFPKVRTPGQRPLVLALGGGAAKGIAHLGVLQRLQEEGIAVDGIAGTSMGALMGSLYATGYSAFSIQRMLEDLDVGAMLLDHQRRTPGETLSEQEHERAPLINLEFKPSEGLTFGHGQASDLNIKRVLQVVLSRGAMQADGDFDRLRTPFRAVSTNLETGRLHAPAKGDLALAVRASMCIPGVFRPVLIDGQQHVDGMLVQNLPVETARLLDPGAAVVAVEVGKDLDRTRQNSIFKVAVRSLGACVEDRTQLSRSACDLLLRPRTDAIPYLEFRRSIKVAVEEGRAALDSHLDQLETLLYGPQLDEPVACGELRWAVPPALAAPLQAIAAASGAGQTRTLRPYLRLLRRMYASGLVQDATVTFLPDAVVVTAWPQPFIRRIVVEGSPVWRSFAQAALDEAGLRPGQPFNPVRLGEAVDGLFLRATLLGRPLVDARATSFDPVTGTLTVRLKEWIPESLRIAGGDLTQGEVRDLHRTLHPFEGRPLEVRSLVGQSILAERRLDLEELQVEKDPGRTGFGLLVRPVPDRRLTVDGTLAYETTWRVHGSIEADTHHLLDGDLGLNLQASSNRLWNDLMLGARFPASRNPRLTAVVSARQQEQHFLERQDLLPQQDKALGTRLRGQRLWTRSLAAGLRTRVGLEDRGELAFEAGRTWAGFRHPEDRLKVPDSTQVQARFEWDGFDRYLFPTTGTLVRVRVGEGHASSAGLDNAASSFRFAYARLRGLKPLGGLGSLEGDMETGLGQDLPLDRWYRVGGPGFLAGSASSEFFTPNFAILRLGFHVKVFTAFGLTMEVYPRLDAGYLGSDSYRRLLDGTWARGAGVSLRAEVGHWYSELAAGVRSLSGQAAGDAWHVNVLLGTHPLDLWK